MARKKLKPLEYAFYLLKSRDRSIGEMKERLGRRECTLEEINETITFLVEKDFLNDQRFAENFVRYKKIIKPVGKFYLRNKLMGKKIPVEIIEKALSETPDESSEIEELAERWMKKNQKVTREKIYQKLSRHLISRGFEWEKVREVVNEKCHRGGGEGSYIR
jgi:regulatory protein